MSMSQGVKQMIDREDQVAAAKMAIGAGGAAAYGLTLNEWVAIFTILYLVLQIGLLLPKYVQIAKDYFRKEKA